MKKKVEFFPFVKTILFSPIIWKITCVCYNMFNLNIYFCLFSDHIRTSIISSKLLFYGLLQRFGIMSTTMQPIDCCNSLRIISNFLLSSRSPTMAPPLPKSWKNSFNLVIKISTKLSFVWPILAQKFKFDIFYFWR